MQHSCVCGDLMAERTVNRSAFCDLCGSEGGRNAIFISCMNAIHPQGLDICMLCNKNLITSQSLQLRWIDKLVTGYYISMNVLDKDKFGKFCAYIEESHLDDDNIPIKGQLGDDCSAENCLYTSFDPEFPIPKQIDSLIKNGKLTKKQIVFYVLQYSYKYHKYESVKHKQQLMRSKKIQSGEKIKSLPALAFLYWL
eukprot:412831_1